MAKKSAGTEYCFVAYPKKGSFPIEERKQRGQLSISDLVDIHGVDGPTDLEMRVDSWVESKDPVDALRVFLLCEAMRVYPPVGVIKQLADAIEVYLLKGRGKPSLDSLLELVGSKGARPRIAEQRARVKKANAVWFAYRLMHVEDISGAEASRRVAQQNGYKPETIERALSKVRRQYDDKGLGYLLTKRRVHLVK